MKRRAKLAKQSVASRVAQWDAVSPNLPASQVAKELKINLKQVYNARCSNRKSNKIEQHARLYGKLDGSQELEPFNEQVVLAVVKLGVPQVERALKLLKALGK